MKSLHLLYHELRPAKTRYSYVMPCDEFQAHCEMFARVRQGSGSFTPEITFDDGHDSDARYAVPILGRSGLRATFFITAGWTGTRVGFMGWAELRELQDAGHRLGAHGLTHKLLTACSATELDAELAGARKRLEDGLGSEVRLMSLPGGRASGDVLRACFRSGFHQVFTSNPRAEQMEDAPRTVGRLNLLAGTTVPWLERVLDPGSGALARVTRVYQAKAIAQRVLGDRAYRKLWALANREELAGDEAELPAV
jgi:peptidoglycan/xylan/chitin deacetylase (PgdA/CDA1 family)